MKQIKITIGGISKEELISLLKEKNILINPLGEKLLESDLFQVTKERQEIDLTEISLIELGLTDGKAGLLKVIIQAENVGWY
jgi:helix-turn-helix protein